MKILSLDIKGYRSLKDVHWEPGDLNVLIGPNGSGKSNLLRFLEMVSESAKGRLDGNILHSGGMGAVVWDGQAKSIEYDLHTSPLPKQAAQKGSAAQGFSYTCRFDRIASTSEYRIDDERLYYLVDPDKFSVPDREWPKIPLVQRSGISGSVVVKEDANETPQSVDSLPPTESLLSQTTGPFVVDQWASTYRSLLSEWAVYQDFRTDRRAQIRQANLTRYATRLEPNGENLLQVLNTLYEAPDKQFQEDVDLAMRAAFGDDFEGIDFPAAADQMFQLRIRWKNLKHSRSTADLSDGILRFLFLITALAAPDPPALIAIDEPETGLHRGMFPIIAEYAVEAAEKTQVIFTTHSPEFLDGFHDTKPKVTVVEWKDGETHLMELDEKKLGEWLEGYSLGKLMRSGEAEDGFLAKEPESSRGTV